MSHTHRAQAVINFFKIIYINAVYVCVKGFYVVEPGQETDDAGTPRPLSSFGISQLISESALSRMFPNSHSNNNNKAMMGSMANNNNNSNLTINVGYDLNNINININNVVENGDSTTTTTTTTTTTDMDLENAEKPDSASTDDNNNTNNDDDDDNNNNNNADDDDGMTSGGDNYLDHYDDGLQWQGFLLSILWGKKKIDLFIHLSIISYII